MSEKSENLMIHPKFIIKSSNNVDATIYESYVGENAFSRKGGLHASAVEKNPTTYEHINPELVGNNRNVIISRI